MAKRTCRKGHIYDSNIYGDDCPFCPSRDMAAAGTGYGQTVGNFDMAENNDGRTYVGGAADMGATAGLTVPVGGGVAGGGIGGGTVIRPAGGAVAERKIIGLLITYDTTPSGQVFPVFEGRNYVGRDVTADINVGGDSEVSGKHFSILYRAADGKFKFRDEQSTNGTYLNEVLTDEGELSSFDIIRIGATKLIFISIPQIV